MFQQRKSLVIALVAALALGCRSSTNAPLAIEATVHFATGIEAGCWALTTAANKTYQPVDLPAVFQIEGLRVRVVLTDAPGWASICYAGPLVHVNSIWVP